jgi:hypothetical protein
MLRPLEPRYFGLVSPGFVLPIAAGLIVLGIVLVVIGPWVAGVIAIVAGACLLPTVVAGVRRWPTRSSPLVQASVKTAERVRDEGAVAVESISTWSKAGRDLVRHRRRQLQLRRERDAKIRELGVSAYTEDGRADELKAAAKELDEQIEANERAMQRTLAAARRRIRKERAAVAATEVIGPEPADEADESKPES